MVSFTISSAIQSLASLTLKVNCISFTSVISFSSSVVSDHDIYVISEDLFSRREFNVYPNKASSSIPVILILQNSLSTTVISENSGKGASVSKTSVSEASSSFSGVTSAICSDCVLSVEELSSPPVLEQAESKNTKCHGALASWFRSLIFDYAFGRKQLSISKTLSLRLSI